MACRGGDSRGRHYSDYPSVGANASSCLHVLPCTSWRLNTHVAVFFSLSFKRLSSTAREHGRGWEGGRKGAGPNTDCFLEKTMRSKPPKKKGGNRGASTGDAGRRHCRRCGVTPPGCCSSFTRCRKIHSCSITGRKKQTKKRTIPAKAGASAECCVECRTIDEPPSLCWLQMKVGDSGCLQRQDFLCGKKTQKQTNKKKKLEKMAMIWLESL